MNTLWLLVAQYEGQAAIPLDRIRVDYFQGMSKPVFTQKVESGEIPLPVAILGTTQKSPKVVQLVDLAKYIDDRAEVARKELARKVG